MSANRRGRGASAARRGRDRAVGILVLLTVLAVAAGALVLLRGQLFAVRNIVIEGENLVRDEVIRVSGLRVGMPMSQVNEARVRANLEASGQLSLEELAVELPDTVALRIRVRTRDALVLFGGSYLALDADGVVMGTTREDAGPQQIYVYGINASGSTVGQRISAPEDKLQAMRAVIEGLKALDCMELVHDLDVSDPQDIRLDTMSGVVVLLGDSEDMLNKLNWMIPAVKDLQERGENGGTLDVRGGNGADYRS